MESDIYKNLGKRIRKLRESRNLSQEYVANILGYKSRVTMSKIESGTYTVNADMLHKLSELFHVSIDDLIEEDEESKSEKELATILQSDESLSAEDIDRILDYIQFLKDQKSRGKK